MEKTKRLIAVLLALAMLLTGCAGPKSESTPGFASRLSDIFTDFVEKNSPSESSEPESKPTPKPEPSEPTGTQTDGYCPTDEELRAAGEAWRAACAESRGSWSTYADLTVDPPDTDRLLADCRDLAERARTERDADAFFVSYDGLCSRVDSLVGTLQLVTVQHDLDVSDTELSRTLLMLSSAYDDLLTELSSMMDAILGNPTLFAWVKTHWTDTTIGYARSAFSVSGDTAALSEQLTELELEFDSLRAGYTLSYEGKEWTLDDIVRLGGDRFNELYDAYLQDYHDTFGELFLRMRDLRCEEAEIAGFDSYAEYCYVSDGNDYTAEDVQDFCDAVKEWIVPLYEELYWGMLPSERDQLNDRIYAPKKTLTALGAMAEDMDPRLGEAYSLMIERGLCDLEHTDDKGGGAYTMNLMTYGAPFINMDYTGNEWSVTSLIHEFGHFYSYLRMPAAKLEEPDSVDLAEIDSQGLQLLSFPYYESFYSEAYADAARAEMLLNAMEALITGCMEDEFQRLLYADPDLTLDGLDELYAGLVKEYGLDRTVGYTGTDWVFIDHTFTSPLYYISYALSMTPALELWAESQEDWDAAMDHYLEFIELRGHGFSFREALARFDFRDPFDDADLLSDISELISDYAYHSLIDREVAA